MELHQILFAFDSFMCLIINCLLMIIPTLDILHIYKTKETNKYPYLYLILTAVCYYAWAVYGWKVDALPLLWSSLIGVMFNIIFVIVFIYSTLLNSKFKLFLSFSFLFVFILLLIIESLINISENIYGLFGSISECIVAVSTIQKLKEAIMLRDISYIPIRLIITFWVNNIFWIWYAIELKDFFIILPNVMAFLLNSIQISLYRIYSGEIKRKNTIDEVSLFYELMVK